MSNSVSKTITTQEKRFKTDFEEKYELPSNISNTAFAIISILTFITPLFFGGVHLVYNYLAYLLTFGALTFISIKIFSNKLHLTRFLKNTRSFLLCLTFFLFITIQSLLLSKSPIFDFDIFLSNIMSWVFFLGIFLLASLYLDSGIDKYKKLQLLLIGVGFFLSLIGMGHWFYDNGNLFWIFEPQNRFFSERARWPFVNANHLGNFLLLSIFCQISALHSIANEILLVRQALQEKGRDIKNILSNKKLHNLVIKFSFGLVIFLTMAICITATLSRGTWIGCFVGLLVYIITYSLFTVQNDLSNLSCKSNVTVVKFKQKKRSFDVIIKDSLINFLKRNSKYLLLALLLFSFFLLLNQKGRELLQGRIEYGLKYSMDDIRWTMYADTWRMINDYPLFGLGLGQWADNYRLYMDESLAGLTPTYLHSEPLQALAELGFIGFGVIFVAFSWIIVNAINKISKVGPSHRTVHIGALSAIIAFFIASFFEFPLRMPAIQIVLALNLAMVFNAIWCSDND